MSHLTFVRSHKNTGTVVQAPFYFLVVIVSVPSLNWPGYTYISANQLYFDILPEMDNRVYIFAAFINDRIEYVEADCQGYSEFNSQSLKKMIKCYPSSLAHLVLS